MTLSKPKRSVLPVLLLALAAVTWMYFYTAGNSPDPWEPFRTEEDNAAIEAASEVERAGSIEQEAGGVERTDLEFPEGVEQDGLAKKENQVKPVRVRAELRLEENQPGSAPNDVEGWTVVVQTWDDANATTPRFESMVNQQGIAELEFPGDVHIDWVSCLPPAGSGFGFSFVEEHQDLRLGDDYLAVLPLEPSRTAFGKVLDQDGRPVAGAIVHAFDENWTYGLSDWTPGFLQTKTNSQGRFEFPQLRNGNWVFAVEPSDWLMVNPMYGHQQNYEGAAVFSEEEQGPIDVGTLQVVPLSTVHALVTDLKGTPIPGAVLFVEPLTYDANYLIPTAYDLEKMEEHAREQTDAFINVGDYREFFTADDAGKITLRLVAGRWQAWAAPLPGMDSNEIKTPHLEFHTQDGVLNYKLPVLTISISGAVSGTDGSSPPAEVRFAWKGKDYEDYVELMTDADGRFEIVGTHAEGGYEVRAWPESTGWLPQQWNFPMEELGAPLDLVLEPGASLSLRFQNMQEEPNNARYGIVRLESWTPLKKGPVDLDAYWWKTKKGRKLNVVSGRTLTISGLAPGSYEVSLALPQPNYQAKTGTKPDWYERQRWTIRTQPDIHTLVIGE